MVRSFFSGETAVSYTHLDVYKRQVGDIYSANVGRGFQERFDALQECLSDNHLELDRKHCLLTETSDEFQDFQTVVKKLRCV